MNILTWISCISLFGTVSHYCTHICDDTQSSLAIHILTIISKWFPTLRLMISIAAGPERIVSRDIWCVYPAVPVCSVIGHRINRWYWKERQDELSGGEGPNADLLPACGRYGDRWFLPHADGAQGRPKMDGPEMEKYVTGDEPFTLLETGLSF